MFCNCHCCHCCGCCYFKHFCCFSSSALWYKTHAHNHGFSQKRAANADEAPGSKGYHEHGTAAPLPMFHHSQGRNEGLLYASGERESSTQTSLAATHASSTLQVPVPVQAASYEASGGPEDVYHTTPNERFQDGTEVRRK